MNLITEFWKKIKTPIFWTIGYVACLWFLLQILFNFDLFNTRHWIHVSHAHLHGLGGLTFCVMILSAIPLYIASMFFIFRNQKPFFTIPMPKFITTICNKLFSKSKSEPEPAPEKNESESDDIDTPETPDHFPTEMRGAFIHARTHPNRITTPICATCSTNPNIYPNNTAPAMPAELNNEMPLPPDFDDAPDMNTDPVSSAPAFQDIKFFDDEDDEIPDNDYIDETVIEHLQKTNREFNIIDDDLILTNDMVIATHNDDDFWIMDEPTWFAAGKTRQSPIDALLNAAKQHKTKPILYLGATNIMNMDAKITEWTGKGITIITDLSNL